MMELNPVMVKELRGRMRGPRAFILLTIYLGILGGVMILLYLAIANSVGNSLNAGQEVGRGLFLTIATVALIEVCIIMPTLTAGGIVGEKERQTYDLLIASQLSPWQIIWGKLGSALGFGLLLIIAIAPLMSIAFLFGGVSLTEVIIAILGLIATSVFFASVGMFWSSVMQSTLGANSFALGSIIAMLLGVPFLVFVISLIFDFSIWEESPILIYLGLIFISVHPFIALGMSEAFIIADEGVFLITLDLANNITIVIPSPWIVFMILSFLFSVFFILISMRRLRPDDPTVKQHQKTPLKEL
ncbi:MAG: ABC-type Na+ efflux pump, permease component [Chloroflexi bacterium AL-W]|nr:ABC-type Na+ efflux pump, permease component [Chloroflexi bacterium AL-N1]NOK68931.1 ABC-type Na+ efflux pump, permease component [Chloroflexi bacterium AL-N10]NOK76914.1 ABC-type Na+ efflux pump, permease component [Chloroflexi bacterium AL-N5]NOK82698.1 ABC-type Na+ efflux pump, permease component [Chloroflexi bacterium AL-W]NOK90771.1 ABC-type Na+ efflux pump, permease component [Chloroflexi bacterium AL-N15]